MGGISEASWGVLGASSAVLNADECEKANMLKMFVFRKEWGDFCVLGGCLKAFWGSLGVLWTVLKQFRSLLERSCAVLGLP